MNGIVDAGSVKLINGTTGTLISSTSGDNVDDEIGGQRIVLLQNNNFVISSSQDDVNNNRDAGSVRLLNGTTGAQIGTTLTGDSARDLFGAGVYGLTSNNFVVVSSQDDVNGVADAGSINLISGTTGMQIGNTVAGDNVDDGIGSGDTIPLTNGNFVVISRYDTQNNITFAGSIIHINGKTGSQIGDTIIGSVADDFFKATVTESSKNDFIILGLRMVDKNNSEDSGIVHLVTQ